MKGGEVFFLFFRELPHRLSLPPPSLSLPKKKKKNSSHLAQQAPGLPQPLDDGGGPLLQHREALQPLPRLGGEPARVVDGGGHRQPAPQPDAVVLLAVARRGVDEACPGLGGDVLPPDDDAAHGGVGGVRGVERGAVGGALEGGAGEGDEELERGRGLRGGGAAVPPPLARRRRLGRLGLRPRLGHLGRHGPGQRLRDDEERAPVSQVHDGVGEALVDGDGGVRGESPRRRRPDRQGEAPVLLPRPPPRERRRGALREGLDRQCDPHGPRNMPGRVLQLGLGERRPRARGPVHGLPAAVDVPAQRERAEDAELRRLVPRVQRHVGAAPVSEQAVAAELGALRVHGALGELAGPRAQRLRRQRSPLGVGQRLQHLELDGQAVAVPARHVPGPVALEQLPVDDE